MSDIKGEQEFRECAECEYIEDCPHPTVTGEGKHTHPDHCTKKGCVKLTKRTITDEDILIYGKNKKHV